MQKLWVSVFLGLLCCGCSPATPDRKDTFKVTGQVLVDDKPAGELAVYCHNTAGIDKSDPTYSACFTEKDGKFALSTFEKGDGVPPGDYALTFAWKQFISMKYDGPDKLHDRYSVPEKSTFKFTVTPGQATDLGQIKLTTK